MLHRWGVALLLGLACLGPAPGCHREDQPAPTSPAEALPEGRFHRIGQEILRDTRTGLEWTRRDSPGDAPWPDAERHCRRLRLGGARSWRLPEIAELESLYDPQESAPCGEATCRHDPAFELGKPYVWSGTAAGPSRRFYFDLRFGTRLSPQIRPGLQRRVLCVRTADARGS